MCGILGSVNISFDNSALDLIKHRGPDDFGNEEVVVNNNAVKFGQRRLSIVDLSPAGHQPMYTDSGDCLIILNGEIYNHLELRAKLSKEIKFRGHSDTETILYYIREFGIKGISDFNGIFALAFLDKKNSKLYLARDPMGVKPLYYSEGECNDIVFSSEIRAAEALISDSELDSDALSSLLRLRYNPSPDTLNKKIKKIRPGHYCEIDLDPDNVTVRHFSFVREIPATIKAPQDVIKEYGKKLDAAVERQLLSDVEVGVLLSGGIDSALVAALASKHYNGRLKAFTIGFEGDYSEDEIDDAAETADLLGLDHSYKKISFTDFLQMIEKCTHIVEEPLATTSIIPMYFLSELASKEVKVVLTGQGADEPLGGYTRYKSELVRYRMPGFLYKSLIPVLNQLSIHNENIKRGFNTLGINDEIDRFLAIWEVFNTKEIESLISFPDNHSSREVHYWYNLLNCQKKKHPVERLMALDTRLNLADDLLNYTDKITMNFGLECRVPMLDLELVNYIESLPPHFKLNMKNGKLVHKRFAEELLPSRIVNRKKKGFLSPTNNWFKNEADVIRSILLKGETNFSRIFNQSKVEEIIRQHQQGYNKEKQIFLLLSIYFWLESLSWDPKIIQK